MRGKFEDLGDQMAISKHYPEGFQWQNQLPGGKTRILPDPVDDQVMEFMKDYLQMKKEMKQKALDKVKKKKK